MWCVLGPAIEINIDECWSQLLLQKEQQAARALLCEGQMKGEILAPLPSVHGEQEGRWRIQQAQRCPYLRDVALRYVSTSVRFCIILGTQGLEL